MSDVVATIILLALTVTLFGAIFAFVTSFPPPPPQNNNQFQATLVYTGNLTYITGVNILHLAGPAVTGTSQIYLESATQPTEPEFSTPYTVASQVLAYATVTGFHSWNLGQTWNLTFGAHYMPKAGGNITVYIVSASQLLFSVILPGTTIAAPPTVVATSISPATPSIDAPFTVYATLAGAYTANSVYVNLAAVPGAPSTPQKMTQNGQGQWTFPVSSGATTNGTFYGFVNASNGVGAQATGAVVITIYPSGGSSNGPLSVGVVLVPSPPNSGASESVQAIVTYTGTVSGAAVNVTFAGSSSPSGYTYSGFGPSGVTISGPSSETLVSQSVWTLPAPNSLYTYTVSATAKVTGVGTVTGSTTFEPVLLTASPTSGIVGAAITATGSAFSTITGSNVTLSIGGVAVTPSACTSGTIFGSQVRPATGGGFSCTIAVPNGATQGATTVFASDAVTGQSDSFAFTVTPWVVTITSPSPATGLQGATVTISGSGWVAGTLTFSFGGLSVAFSACTTGTPSGSTITPTGGGFTGCTFPVPYGSAAGADSLTVSDSASTQTASATFTVKPWTLSVSPTTGSHTGTVAVTLTGAGFAAGSTLSITLNGTLLVSGTLSFACSATCTLSGSTITLTGATGGFSCTLTLAKAAGAAIYTFAASDYTSGQTASTQFSRT